MSKEAGGRSVPVEPPATRRTYTVMLVDDQPTFIELVRANLDRTDWLNVVGSVCCGSEALELARDLRPDVAIVDVFMPGMNGFETTRRLLAEQPELRVIVVSAEGYPEHPAYARSVGAIGFLDKRHLRPDALRALLEPSG